MSSVDISPFALAATGSFVVILVIIAIVRRTLGRGRLTDEPLWTGGLGDKPVLVDIHARRMGVIAEESEGGVGWKGMTPPAVSFTPSSIPHVPAHLPSHPTPMRLQPTPRFRLTRKSKTGDQQEQDTKSRAEDGIGLGHLEVTVAIVMPSPSSSRPKYKYLAEDDGASEMLRLGDEDGEQLDYALGMVRVPWDHRQHPRIPL